MSLQLALNGSVLRRGKWSGIETAADENARGEFSPP
jgi:hypothetical protein